MSRSVRPRSDIYLPYGFKVCKRCDEAKPQDAFSPNGMGTKGSYCRPCAAARMRESYQARTPVTEPTVTESQCSACRRLLPRAKFQRSAKTSTGLQLYCTECQVKLTTGSKVADIRIEYGLPTGRMRRWFIRPTGGTK